jgi:hypothetical protein
VLGFTQQNNGAYSLAVRAALRHLSWKQPKVDLAQFCPVHWEIDTMHGRGNPAQTVNALLSLRLLLPAI